MGSTHAPSNSVLVNSGVGVAILVVFAYHSLGALFGRQQLSWHQWFPDFNVPRSFLLLLPITLGWAGVALFFVVSGFCIHLSFSKSPQWSLFFDDGFLGFIRFISSPSYFSRSFSPLPVCIPFRRRARTSLSVICSCSIILAFSQPLASMHPIGLSAWRCSFMLYIHF